MYGAMERVAGVAPCTGNGVHYQSTVTRKLINKVKVEVKNEIVVKKFGFTSH